MQHRDSLAGSLPKYQSAVGVEHAEHESQGMRNPEGVHVVQPYLLAHEEQQALQARLSHPALIHGPELVPHLNVAGRNTDAVVPLQTKALV